MSIFTAASSSAYDWRLIIVVSLAVLVVTVVAVVITTSTSLGLLHTAAARGLLAPQRRISIAKIFAPGADPVLLVGAVAAAACCCITLFKTNAISCSKCKRFLLRCGAMLSKHFYQRICNVRSCRKMPPGPIGLPIIGHLHFLLKLPHQSLYRLARKFGPVMAIKLGNRTAIVISSKDAAKEVLTTYDRIFASRPVLMSPETLCYGSRDIACCEYGPYWRNMRKICTTHLFSAKRIRSFHHIRIDETHQLLRRVAAQAKMQIPVDMKRELSTLTLNVITRMSFGKRFDHAADHSGFLGVILEAVGLMGAVNLGDYVPLLKWMDPRGYIPRLQTTSRQIDGVLQKLVDEHHHDAQHVADDGAGGQDMVHALLSLGVDDDSIKAVILDVLAGGTDTTAVTTEWALSELIRNGECQQTAQQEIESIVGNERLVDEQDLPRLHYLRAVVKETFRLHPAAPMMAPHESIEECTLRGYRIPKKTWVMINVWAIGRDPDIWQSPQEFRPERFLHESSTVDVKGFDFELLPFGSGRRMCIGMSLALCMVELTLARLLQAFSWTAHPHDLRMEERQGVIVGKKYPLVATAFWRLPHVEIERNA